MPSQSLIHVAPAGKALIVLGFLHPLQPGPNPGNSRRAYTPGMQLELALTGALPALAAMWYVDRLDAKRPEPRWTLRKVALAGAISVIPCIAAELALTRVGPHVVGAILGALDLEHETLYGAALYHGFVVAAGVEELAKLLCVHWFVWHKPEFDERMDGIVYATRAGLGFAMVENVLYLLGTEGGGEFLAVYVARALLAVPGHAIWAGFMGYYAARRRFDRAGPGVIGGYLIAVFLHGAYDAAVFLRAPLIDDGYTAVANGLLLIPVAIIIGGGIVLRRLARRAVLADDASEALAAGRSS